jgi:hypothetical protein
MGRKKNGASKSEQIRQLLITNPEVGAKEAVAMLAEKGIEVSENLYYYTKGQMKGRKSRKKRAQKVVSKVAEATGVVRSDALATILKVKALATEVGGLKKLRALVDALGG